jgi:phage head maturation protease
VFTETSFARQLQGFAARPDLVRRVGFNLDHRTELDRTIGWTDAVTSTSAGLVARFGLYPTANLDLVRSMLAETHTGLSVECAVHKSRLRPDGVMERRVVQLVGVAATPVPAYAGAGITAIRADMLGNTAQDDRGADDVMPTPLLDAVAARWGFTD